MKKTCRNCRKYNNCFHAFTNDQICTRGHVMKGNNMKFKVGDKVMITESSFSFGIYNNKFSWGSRSAQENLIVVKTGLEITRYPNDECEKGHAYYTVNDLLVTDGDGNFWFVQSRFCKLTDKKIELRYFCDGNDVTDNISDETKSNLRAIGR